MPRIPLILFVSALLFGCATQSQGSTHSLTSANADDAKTDPESGGLSAMQRKQNEQQKHIAELEARIGLLEADARRQRELAGAERSAPTQTVHIKLSARASADSTSDTTDTSQAESERDADTAPREQPVARGKHDRIPNLRLYGHAEAEAQNEPLPVTTETLLVAPLPGERARALSAGAAVPEADGGGALGGYREGLRLLRERRYDEALAALDTVAAQFPSDPVMDKVLYWRGEARYAKRDYPRAKQEFDALLARFPQSEKLPDTLLKLGLCLRRLGDEARAQAYFRRVRDEYPGSQAAAIASREGST